MLSCPALVRRKRIEQLVFDSTRVHLPFLPLAGQATLAAFASSIHRGAAKGLRRLLEEQHGARLCGGARSGARLFGREGRRARIARWEQ